MTRRAYVPLGLAVLAGLCACHREDFRTVEIAVPRMDCAACAERVRYALSGYEDFRMLRRVETDPDARIVRVTYDRRRVALKNIEWMIAAYGFDAGGTPATPEAAARLPETCE